MPNDITATASNNATGYGMQLVLDEVRALKQENALLSGRVELTMRLLARIVAKMDPGFLDDPNDPEVKRRSDLLGSEIIHKLKREAIAQASCDAEAFDRLQRYLKNVP